MEAFLIGAVIVVLALLILSLVWNYNMYNAMMDRFDRVDNDLNQFRTRQSKIAVSRENTKPPQVDFHPRTTVRDTPDIEARGARMSTAVHRKRTDADDRVNSGS